MRRHSPEIVQDTRVDMKIFSRSNNNGLILRLTQNPTACHLETNHGMTITCLSFEAPYLLPRSFILQAGEYLPPDPKASRTPPRETTEPTSIACPLPQLSK